MGTSRHQLAPYFGQQIAVKGTLTSFCRGRLSLLTGVEMNSLLLCDHLWLMLPKQHPRPGNILSLSGIVSKYYRSDDFSEDYTLQRVHLL